MEFYEKLQELRKNRGLTQEELAEALYVSRTAISKWESGRGYPSIDSLKEISKFFLVTVDDLLSGEKLLSLAEKENRENIRSMCNLLFGMTDIGFILLIILPLYPRTMDGFIYSVNLFAYTEIASLSRLIYWITLIFLILVGVIKVVLTKCKITKGQKFTTYVSITINILLVLFFAMTREVYAVIMAFLLLVVKGVLLLKIVKNSVKIV